MQNSVIRIRLTPVRRMCIMPLMMKFADVLKALAACKGGRDWALVAEMSGMHYDTLARIARGDIGNPGVLAVEKIAAALEKIKATKAKETSA